MNEDDSNQISGLLMQEYQPAESIEQADVIMLNMLGPGKTGTEGKEQAGRASGAKEENPDL